MNAYQKNVDGSFSYNFSFNRKDPRTKKYRKEFLSSMIEAVAEFAPSARKDRTYDAEAILGQDWVDCFGLPEFLDTSLFETLSFVVSLPNSPLIEVKHPYDFQNRFALR